MYDIEYLSRLIDKFHKEAKISYKNRCYIASMILYGTTLEAMLLGMCFAYYDQVRETKIFRKVKDRCMYKKIRSKGFLLEFSLNDLIKVAEELKWFPMKEKIDEIGKFEDWVQWVRETRNLVHPVCWLKPDRYFGNIHRLLKESKTKDLKKYIKISEETINVVSELLLSKIEKDFEKQLKLKR